MNQAIFRDEKVDGGKEFKVFTPNGEDYIKTQFSEIFIDGHYKLGLVKKDMVVIDAGANVGLASLYLEGHSKVIYAIEPNPQNYAALIQNVEGHGNIKCFNVGLASRDIEGYLRSNEDSNVSETLLGDGLETDRVKLTRIDTFFRENSIEHVDLLKMDTEGAEYIVFPSQSFKNVSSKIDYIIGESHYFDKIMPDYLPLIMEDVGFDFKFLPIENTFLRFHFSEDGYEKTYTVNKQSLFFAKRKDLSWPI